jgi:SAM-dependent methyltransferase
VFTAVDAYDRYVGRYSPKLARRLIEMAGIARGDRALDVGCGTGALTGALVEALGADHVAAVDPSEAFLQACRSRYPGIRGEVASGESLPFDDDSFDAALAQLVVNFMSDAQAGVGEMKRVTRPGGAVVGAVWDYGGEMWLIRSFWDAARAISTDGQVAQDERQMRYATPEALGALWREVGLLSVEVAPAVVSANYENFEDLWSPLAAGVGPAGAYTVALRDDEREQLKDELRRQLGVGDAPCELTARAWVAVGRAP